MPHDNQKVTIKISPMVCTPSEEPYKTTLMAKFDDIEEKIQTSVEGLNTKIDEELAKINGTLDEFRTDTDDIPEDLTSKYFHLLLHTPSKYILLQENKSELRNRLTYRVLIYIFEVRINFFYLK